jgi:hypothetical protein
MKYKNEGDIKQALGIESWRNLSKDKMIRFVMMTRDMDAELAAKIVEQFPVFSEFGTGVVGALRKMQKTTLRANKESQEHFHQSCKAMIEILTVELNKEGLSFEEKKYLIEQVQATLKLEYQKDSENKQFLDGVLKKVLMAVGGVLVLGGALVGARVAIDGTDSPEAEDSLESDEDSLEA